MNQENKKLLLKDLSARLPYGVKVKVRYCYEYEDGSIKKYNEIKYLDAEILDLLIRGDRALDKIKPYLRQMSSMTEEEENEFKKIFELELKAIESTEGHTIESAASSAFAIDFYNKYHFDYRGLIPMGLAIAVTEENNPYKE